MDPHPRSSGSSGGPVVVLVTIIAVLLTVWVLGAILLVHYAPELADAPASRPTTTGSR